jgi:AsmA protein
MRVLEDTLKGSAAVAMAGSGRKSTTTFSLALNSPRLDADRLLMDDEESKPYESGRPEPPKDPARFNGLRGDIRMEVGALRYQDTDLKNVRAELKMVDDLVTVERFDAGAFGGTVAAGGSSVRLGPAPNARPFTAKVQAKGLNVAQLMSITGDKKVLTGTFNGGVDLTGVGYEMEELEQRLIGGIQGEMLNGSFLGLDVLSAVTQPLAKALPIAAKPLSMSGEVTRLAEQLPFSVTIEKGVAQLKNPITWTRPEGRLSFDGGIRLDGTLALAGTVELSPQSIRTLTLGKVTPGGPIPLALKLGGPAWKPQVQGLDVKPAALAIARQAAASAATSLLGEKGKAVQGVIEAGPQAAAEQARKEAEQRAAQEKARLEEQARREADAARRRTEEEAKKRLKGLFGR